MEILLIKLVLVILVVGFLVWLVDQIDSIDAQYKKIAKGVLLFALVAYVIVICLQLLGVNLPPLR